MLFNRKRDHLEIIAEIVLLCKKPKVKTRIMYETRLSYAQLRRFLMQLRLLNLLEVRTNPERYVTTEKGLYFLQNWREVQRSLRMPSKKPIAEFDPERVYAKRERTDFAKLLGYDEDKRS